MKNIHDVPIPFIGTYGALAMVAKRKHLQAHTSQSLAPRTDKHTLPKYVPGTVKKNRNAKNRNGKESTRLGRIL